jgi:glycine oxidase
MSSLQRSISHRGSAVSERNPDCVIIGGGVIGCGVARSLSRLGLHVAVLERGSPGRQATWAAAGMLSPLSEAAHEDPLFCMAVASLDLWPTFAAEIAAESGLDVEYRPAGKLHIAFDEEGESHLRSIRSRGAGFGVQLLAGHEARAVEPVLSADVGSALLVGRDHRVNNRVLGEAAWKAAARAGADFRLDAEAAEVVIGRDRRVAAVRLQDGTTIPTGRVILAAGAWSGQIGGLPRVVPVEPVRGQMFAVDATAWRPRARPFLEHTIDAPGCYFIPRDNGWVLVGATVEHTAFAAGPTPGGIAGLVGAAIKAVPAIADLPLAETWAGYRPGTPDDLPILGPDPDVSGVFYATGHFRNGVLLAPITAAVVAALVDGEEPPVAIERFRPDRFDAE